MLTNISVPGIKCDCCKAEKALLPGIVINFVKIERTEVVAPGVNKTPKKEEDIYLCETCHRKLINALGDLRIVNNKSVME